MRNAAAASDLQLFKRGLPPNFKDSEANQLMKEVRAGMGLVTEGISYRQFSDKYHIIT